MLYRNCLLNMRYNIVYKTLFPTKNNCWELVESSNWVSNTIYFLVSNLSTFRVANTFPIMYEIESQKNWTHPSSLQNVKGRSRNLCATKNILVELFAAFFSFIGLDIPTGALILIERTLSSPQKAFNMHRPPPPPPQIENRNTQRKEKIRKLIITRVRYIVRYTVFSLSLFDSV